jgi:hypothetical protein
MWSGGEWPIPCHNGDQPLPVTLVPGRRASLRSRAFPATFAEEPPCPAGSSPFPPPPGYSARPPGRSSPSRTSRPRPAAPSSDIAGGAAGWSTTAPSTWTAGPTRPTVPTRSPCRSWSGCRLWRRDDVGVREKAPWRLLYETAARAGEVLSINVEDLELDKSRPDAETLREVVREEPLEHRLAVLSQLAMMAAIDLCQEAQLSGHDLTERSEVGLSIAMSSTQAVRLGSRNG